MYMYMCQTSFTQLAQNYIFLPIKLDICSQKTIKSEYPVNITGWKISFSIAETPLKLYWNVRNVWFPHNFSFEISSFSKFLQCGILGYPKFQAVFVDWNLAITNSISMWNLFGNLAYVQFQPLKLAESHFYIAETLRILLVICKVFEIET